MRIRNPAERDRIFSAQRMEGRKSREEIEINTGGEFGYFLHQVEEKQLRQELDSFLAELEKQGQRLIANCTLEEVIRYRDMVRDFLRTTLPRLYRLREEVRFDRRGRHRIYAVVETIDRRLEELVQAFLHGQQQNLDLLARLGEIRGLLIDLYA